MRTFVLAALLAVGCAHADTVLKNAGSTLGPVLSFDCTADAGLFCQRPSGGTTGALSCANATTTTPGCVSTTAQTFTGAKTFTGPTLFDGGVTVNGSEYVDGGFFANGNAVLDAGLTVKSTASANSIISRSGFYFFNIRGDGGVAYIEGDDPAGNIELGANTGSVNGKRILTLADVVDGGIAFASYRGAYTSDHAWQDGGFCNTFTVSGITGPTCGDGCFVGSEHILPFGMQLSCNFENADGGTGAATRVVVTRCCNDLSSGCDPVSSYYHITGIAQ